MPWHARLFISVINPFSKKDKIIAFGDKNPGYSIYTEKLIKLFPDSKFIYLNRDYRDNFVSLKKSRFWTSFYFHGHIQMEILL